MINKLLFVGCVVGACLSSGVVFAEKITPTQDLEQVEADHQALRALMTRTIAAMNQRDLGPIKDSIDHENFTVIDVTNKKYTTLQEFQGEVTKLFEGDGAVFSKIELAAEADGLTEFISPDVGITHGTSKDVYHFLNGDIREMKSRWTSVVRKVDGQWKISKVHFSVNLLDNPLLETTARAIPFMGGGGAIIGFLFGVLGTLVLKRK